MLPALESFVRDAIVTQRPVAASLFREKTVINYPNNALRELMMNACMHRDYQSNMPIRLYQFDDHIEIMNAGGLYGEARPENFPLVNDYRNPIVAEAMKEMKYVNMFNQGVKRVQDMLRENGNKEAAFDVSKLTVFCVEVYSNEDEISEKISEKTSEKTSEKVIEAIRQKPRITAEELSQMLGVTRRTIEINIKNLRESGIIQREGGRKSGYWVIVDSQ